MDIQNLNLENMIDVRDLIARVEELRDDRDERNGEDWQGGDNFWAAENPELDIELDQLAAILADLAGNGGDEQWEGDRYPVTLVRDSYFTDYARELVSDIGDLPASVPNYIEIDWEATARNIRMDYTSTEIDGVTYWYR